MAELANYGYGLAALTYTACAVALSRREPAAPTTPSGSRMRLVAALAASAVWAVAAVAGGVTAAAVPDLLVALLDVARYGLWFVFLLALLSPSRAGAAKTWPGGLQLAALAITLAAVVLQWLPSDVAGGLGTAALFAQLALPVLGLVLVEQLFRNVDEDLRWHAKPLCLALGSVFLFDVYVYSQAVLFGSPDADALAVRGLVHALAAPLLLVASRRQADASGKLRISRNAAFHTTTLVLVGVYLLFISAIGYYVRLFGGEWGRALQLGLLFAALVLLAAMLLSEQLRARIRVFVGKNFFRYRYDYRTEWLRFTAMLSTRRSPGEVGGLVIRGLASLLHSPGGALWSLQPGSGELTQCASWNTNRSADTVAPDSAFARFLLKGEWIVDLHEYRTHPQRYEGLQPPHWLLALPNAWLVVPLVVADDLTGFVVLSRPHAATRLNWEVRDLLKTASRQAASFLAQMHATEALLEARKFDAFNKMSAFVVHDLKNIVAQLSLMMQNAKRLRDNAEFQQDMLDTVESSLEKMRRMMLQLREGESPAGVVSGVELQRIARGLHDAWQRRGRRLEIEIVEPVVARGHDERIERVIGHMVQNAFDATAEPGRVWLRLERAGSQAKVVVGDTGHGMSEEFVGTRLFKPFTTTKHNGMGIGAYESLQYVHELGGSVAVDSQVDRGTVVTILLPLFEVKRQSDLELLGAK